MLRGGTEGNARLTALTGVVLLGLLAAEGVTILAIRPLLSVHVFVGLLLIPPVALKLAATGYRFVRYYARDLEYARKGPPILLMRMLVAPGLVVSTLGVFVTGVALLVVGPAGGIILGLHKASFVVWLVAFGIHVLAYLFRIPALVDESLAANICRVQTAEITSKVEAVRHQLIGKRYFEALHAVRGLLVVQCG